MTVPETFMQFPSDITRQYYTVLRGNGENVAAGDVKLSKLKIQNVDNWILTNCNQ
jgi:hypothetical protein